MSTLASTTADLKQNYTQRLEMMRKEYDQLAAELTTVSADSARYGVLSEAMEQNLNRRTEISAFLEALNRL